MAYTSGTSISSDVYQGGYPPLTPLTELPVHSGPSMDYWNSQSYSSLSMNPTVSAPLPVTSLPALSSTHYSSYQTSNGGGPPGLVPIVSSHGYPGGAQAPVESLGKAIAGVYSESGAQQLGQEPLPPPWPSDYNAYLTHKFENQLDKAIDSSYSTHQSSDGLPDSDHPTGDHNLQDVLHAFNKSHNPEEQPRFPFSYNGHPGLPPMTGSLGDPSSHHLHSPIGGGDYRGGDWGMDPSSSVSSSKPPLKRAKTDGGSIPRGPSSSFADDDDNDDSLEDGQPPDKERRQANNARERFILLLLSFFFL